MDRSFGREVLGGKEWREMAPAGIVPSSEGRGEKKKMEIVNGIRQNQDDIDKDLDLQSEQRPAVHGFGE